MAQFNISGDVTIQGKLVLGNEIIIQVNKKDVLRMTAEDATNMPKAVILRDSKSGSTIIVSKETGNFLSLGKNPFLLSGNTEEAMQKYNEITSIMIQAYKKSLSG